MIIRAVPQSLIASYKFRQQNSGALLPDPIENQISNIVAPIADYHIDIGKTIGIKQVKFDIVYDTTLANQWLGWRSTEGQTDGCVAWPPGISASKVILYGHSDFYNVSFGCYGGTTNDTPSDSAYGDAGVPTFTPSRTDASNPITATLNASNFRLLNLHFKNELKTTLPTKADINAQIAQGCLFTRPMLFTGPDTGDGTYSQDIFRIYAGYSPPDQDWWNWTFMRDPAIPVKNASDERIEWTDYGYQYDVYSGGYDYSQDPASYFDRPLGNPIGNYLYTLSGRKAKRFQVVVRAAIIPTYGFETFMGIPIGVPTFGNYPRAHPPGPSPLSWLNGLYPAVFSGGAGRFRGMFISGADNNNFPIIDTSQASGVTYNVYQGRINPSLPHDPVTNPYRIFHDYRATTTYNISASVTLTMT